LRNDDQLIRRIEILATSLTMSSKYRHNKEKVSHSYFIDDGQGVTRNDSR
jgi:hypothetical protein